MEEFCIINDSGAILHFNLKRNIEEAPYLETSEDFQIEFSNSIGKGIVWKCNNKTVKIFEKGRNVFGIPFPSLEKVLVIYHDDNHKYSSPRNAVIYNADGSLYMHLEEPKVFLSDLAKKQRPKPYFDEYNGCSWKINEVGQWVMSIYLVYNYNYYEGRVIDELTGELGEVVDSGRY